MTPPDGSTSQPGHSLRRSHAKIAEAHRGMRAAVAQIQQELDELDAKVATLRSEWDGEASRAYEHAQREWTFELNRMRALLEDYGVRLDRINERYRVASEKVRERIWS